MIQEQNRKKNSSGRALFFVLLFLTFALAVWSLFSGHSDLGSRKGKTEADTDFRVSSAETEPSSAVVSTDPEDSTSQLPEGTEERIQFGQVPQSTETPDRDAEPAVLSASETSGTASADSIADSPAESAGTEPAAEEAAAEPETDASADRKAEESSSAAGKNGASEGVAASDASPVMADTSAGDRILVNKTHHLPREYRPEDLVSVSASIEGVGSSDTKKLRKVAADALEQLIAGAAAEGYQIKMRTGFRSYDYQKTLFAGYAEKNGEEAANRYSARAGESEHQTGLCCDVSSPSVGWALSYQYGETDEGSWLAEHCHEYGFIVRYLPGKEEITGYVAEPWHIRYVGVEAASEIYEKGICFEEYLGITD